jgi:hypothetical protein
LCLCVRNFQWKKHGFVRAWHSFDLYIWYRSLCWETALISFFIYLVLLHKENKDNTRLLRCLICRKIWLMEYLLEIFLWVISVQICLFMWLLMAARLMWKKTVAQNLDDMITNSIIQNGRRSSLYDIEVVKTFSSFISSCMWFSTFDNVT